MRKYARMQRKMGPVENTGEGLKILCAKARGGSIPPSRTRCYNSFGLQADVGHSSRVVARMAVPVGTGLRRHFRDTRSVLRSLLDQRNIRFGVIVPDFPSAPLSI